MKYRLELLPLRAFQGRGTPIGGRALRLWGYDEGGNWIATGDEVSDPNLGVAVPDNSGGWTAPAAAPLAAPEPAAAPVDTPAAAPADSGGGGDSAPAPLTAAATAPDQTQTVNDIYQQTFGRQADPSGMATFTALLNQGMTGEQMRAALASSAEGQSMGLSPAPVAPLTAAAQTPQWEWQPAEANGAETIPGYWLDVNSGARQTADPVQYTGVTPVDPNTTPQQLAPNYEGTPTQFYDAQGNLQGVLVDTVKAGLGAKEGSLILDPTSLGLALKPGETPSIDSAIQQRNDQGQLLFVDPTTGGTTIYNTGVPAVTGSTVKDLMYINDPGKRGSIVPADVTQGMIMLAAAMATGGVGGALLDAAGFGAGAASGLGAGAAAGSDIGSFIAADAAAGLGSTGAGLTASDAAALMGGTLSDAGAAATMGGTVADAGINWGAAATAAAKTAAINAAVTAAQGGKLNDILKAGALGAVSAGAGVAGADLLGGGTLAQIGTQTAVATAIAAATGKDPAQAAISGALSATVANLIPAGTADILNSAGITDPSIQKAINSAISSSVIAAIRGGDVGTAALMGAVNSGLTSVAGMIGDTQVVKDLKASLTDTISSTVDSIKYEIGATNAQALPVEGSNRSPVGTPLDTTTQPDVVNNIFQQDAQDAMSRNLPPPPTLVGMAMDQNTPKTIDNVVTPPLIAQAMNQNGYTANDLNNFFANYTPTTGAASEPFATGITRNDADPLGSITGSNLPYVPTPEKPWGDFGDAVTNMFSPNSYLYQNDATLKMSPAEMLREKYDPVLPDYAAEPSATNPVLSPVLTSGIDALVNWASASPDARANIGNIDSILNMAGGVVGLGSYISTRLIQEIAPSLASQPEPQPTTQADVDNASALAYKVMEPLLNVTQKMGGISPSDPAYNSGVIKNAMDAVGNTIHGLAGVISSTTGLPQSDVEAGLQILFPKIVDMAAKGLPNVGAAASDVAAGYSNTRTGITQIEPNLPTSVGQTAGALVNKAFGPIEITPNLPVVGTTLLEGQSAPKSVGALTNATETPALGYTPTTAAGALPVEPKTISPDVANTFNNAFAAADRIPTYDVSPQPTATPATQLAPESRGALPTTLAEPSINPINLGPNIDSGTVAKINTEAQAVDQNLSNLSSPQVQAQAKTFVDNAYTALADKTPSAFTANSLGDIYGLGGTSNDVVAATKSVVENKAASPDTILKQVDQAIAPLNPDEQLPAKLAMLSNASKLGITPAEAINLGLLNNNGTKTELGEKVSPTPQPQPQPQPQPEPVAPLTPVKPVLPPPPTINPPPPSINPPPSVNPPIDVNPVNPVVNPTVNPVNPPAVDVNPPIPTPPPLVQAAITPPTATPKAAAPATTMTPSYMYGAGTQGTTVGALPGNLKGTFLQGVNVNEYNPFENYDKYQQLAPIHAAQGGSPLQLAQMQQGIAGVDPSLYNVLQKRQAPSYFTYGQDTSGGNPTTFAGSQLLGKPTPNIPVIPTGQKSGSDWLYQGSGTNPLAMAGTGIPSLGAGTMAHGGQAHDGGEGEHIPEFITGQTGHYVRGRGDGQSDDIPAMLADGEYVFDASTVSTLGNGSSDAGAKLLDAFRESLRDHTRSAPADKIPPKASPLEYMKEALQHVGRK